MPHFTTAERRGLLLLTLILAAILAILTIRTLTAAPDTPGRHVAPVQPDSLSTTDAPVKASPVIRHRRRRTAKPDTAAATRRKPLPTSTGKSRDYLDDIISTDKAAP